MWRSKPPGRTVNKYNTRVNRYLGTRNKWKPKKESEIYVLVIKVIQEGKQTIKKRDSIENKN